eukprot:gene13137-biopygen12082
MVARTSRQNGARSSAGSRPKVGTGGRGVHLELHLKLLQQRQRRRGAPRTEMQRHRRFSGSAGAREPNTCRDAEGDRKGMHPSQVCLSMLYGISIDSASASSMLYGVSMLCISINTRVSIRIASVLRTRIRAPEFAHASACAAQE